MKLTRESSKTLDWIALCWDWAPAANLWLQHLITTRVPCQVSARFQLKNSLTALCKVISPTGLAQPLSRGLYVERAAWHGRRSLGFIKREMKSQTESLWLIDLFLGLNAQRFVLEHFHTLLAQKWFRLRQAQTHTKMFVSHSIQCRGWSGINMVYPVLGSGWSLNITS